MLNAIEIRTALNEAGYTPNGRMTGDYPLATQRFYINAEPAASSTIYPQISVTYDVEAERVTHIRGFLKDRITNARTWKTFRRSNDEAFNNDSITAIVALIQETWDTQESEAIRRNNTAAESIPPIEDTRGANIG